MSGLSVEVSEPHTDVQLQMHTLRIGSAAFFVKWQLLLGHKYLCLWFLFAAVMADIVAHKNTQLQNMHTVNFSSL